MPTLDVTVDANLTSNTAPVAADRLLIVKSSSASLQDITFAELFHDLAYLSGLKLIWVSGTAITVSAGMTSTESGDFLNIPSLPLTGLSLSANTWYHVYVYNNAGTPAAEVVTTAPVLWKGTAYSKTGDSTRRYVGSVRTNASGLIWNFIHNPIGLIHYLEQLDASPFRVLSAGNATAVTNIDASALIPATSRFAFLKLTNTSASGFIVWGNNDDSAASGFFTQGSNSVVFYPAFPLSSGSILTYANTAASSNTSYCDVIGYYFER